MAASIGDRTGGGNRKVAETEKPNLPPRNRPIPGPSATVCPSDRPSDAARDPHDLEPPPFLRFAVVMDLRYAATMQPRIDEIADGIFRISTFVPQVTPDGFTFNQFLVRADEPLLFHTGMRFLFPAVHEAVGRIVPAASLRWIAFGHVESDECGSMNQWLAAAPRAHVAHGVLGVEVSLNDLADRPPRALQDGETIDLGGKVVRHIDTPHVPHAWESRVLFEESTRTLFCGDLFTHTGDRPPLTTDDIVGPAKAAEDVFHSTALTPATAPTLRALAELEPTTLAVMHGSSFRGNCRQALLDLADDYARRLREATS